ncbi:hypothetical protein Daus18300_004848 [Diaporthe australafricana]|uniref:Uncharacterized protein n=1 Tax=Diaporthe australafricana TaxID=127596 RepID=A0ABR3X5B2_9PEZI
MSSLQPRRDFVNPEWSYWEILEHFGAVLLGGAGTGSLVVYLYEKYKPSVRTIESEDSTPQQRVAAEERIRRDFQDDESDPTRTIWSHFIRTAFKAFNFRRTARAMQQGPLPEDVEMANMQARASTVRNDSNRPSLDPGRSSGGGNSNSSRDGRGGGRPGSNNTGRPGSRDSAGEGSSRPQLHISEGYSYIGQDEAGNYWEKKGSKYKYTSGPGKVWHSASSAPRGLRR